jgi:N-acetylglucosamine-6-sulfatase
MRGGKAYPGAREGEVPDEIAPKTWDPKHKRWLNYMRTLDAVDDGIGRILEVLKEEGKLDDTVIVFAGDNGYFHGEHGRGDKRLIYEESIRIPLLMRYPRKIKAGSSIEQMVLNIDLAPTLLSLAGVDVPSALDGRSLLPLFEGNTDNWRRSFLYEYWMDLTDKLPHMVGVRTENWKLARYPEIDDIDEMYDLRNDPHEMTNLALAPEHAEKHKELSNELDRLLKETGYGSKPIPRDPHIGRRSWGGRRRK